MNADAADIMDSLVKVTEAFLTQLRQNAINPEDQTEALQQLLSTRQTLFDQLPPQRLQDNVAIDLGLTLKDLDQELNAILFNERQRLQRELAKLHQGKKALKGYQHQPLKGRRTLEVEG